VGDKMPWIKCPRCDGRGYVRQSEGTALEAFDVGTSLFELMTLGIFSKGKKCPLCEGKGYIYSPD